MHIRRPTGSFFAVALLAVIAVAGSAFPASAAPVRAAAAPLHAQGERGNQEHGEGGGNAEGAPAQRGGVVRATVVSVDFGRNVLVVEAGGVRRRILLTPTTTLEQSGNRSLSIADLRPGQHVDIYMTFVGGEPIAQIVRLR